MGIPYLGNGNKISASYTVTLYNESFFINSDRKIASCKLFNNGLTTVYTSDTAKTLTGDWTIGSAHDVTSSKAILQHKFLSGTGKVRYYKYNSNTTETRR